MFFARMLVILSSACSGTDAAYTLCQAMERAARPESLRFAVPEACRKDLEGFAGQMMFYSGQMSDAAGWAQGETHFLLLGGRVDFCREWDRQLLRTLQRIPGEKVLLSGCMERPMGSAKKPVKKGLIRPQAQDQPESTKRFKPVQLEESISPDVHGQALLPGLMETAAPNVFQIQPGLPLVCAEKPVRTLLMNPSFVFGPVDYLQSAGLETDTLSLQAYLTGYEVYVPTAASLWPSGRSVSAQLRLPERLLPGTTMARFAQLLGVGRGTLGVKSNWGLFGASNTYPQTLPAGLRMRQRRRGRGERERNLPLFVSAFVDLPQAHHPESAYLLRFGFLKELLCLPLLLFTGGRQERALRAMWPNTQSYPERAIREKMPMIRDVRSSFLRSKVMLMHRATQRQVEFSHVAWVDMDVLPHPICPEAVPALKPMMDEHIHMATVDGTPDPSFVLIPSAMLKRLEEDVLSITHLDGELKRGFSQETLWIHLYQQHPQDFVFHPMPAQGMLLLSTFDRELLSAPLRRLLDGPTERNRRQNHGRKDESAYL